MSTNQHIEWLNLVEKTGPFLAVGVLDEAFPQGLDKVETRRRQRVRSAYDEWRDAVDADDPQLAELHREWVRLILEELLDYDASVLKRDGAIPVAVTYREPSCGVEIRPDFVAMAGEKPRLLVTVCAPDTDLNAPVAGDAWTASPIERMIQLCRATGVRLGLVTDGDRWSLVCVPPDGGSSVGTWFARIWQQEPVTLQAFVSLLGVRRCFGPTDCTMEALLERSVANQNEITDTLGEQVRRAVEVLVQALDKADAAQDRKLLAGVTPAQLYEAGLTVMMRLVVLLCAEQRGLLLLGADTYDQHYAITTLRARLVKEQTDLTDEVQERRHDAWSRILAVCRGVFGGIEHASLRLPPLGGSLFDPDRFPFLEGRSAGSSWRAAPAVLLPIDNRTVLTLLTALQVLEQFAGAQLLSYQALDVEQVGHVYEGLLERTVKRVPEVTLGLSGSAKAYNPNVPLRELEEKSAENRESLLAFLQEATGRSASALRKALDRPADDALRHRVAVACGLDTTLVPRLLPFANLIREDSAKRLLVYAEGSFIVTMGDSRRATGTHYTPKSLTEPIVQHTLEPLVYAGPAEGKSREEWRLKSPADLLALKICDMAMGSAAFLVQTCRWLADRVVEAWDATEKAGQSVSMEGAVLEQAGRAELLPRDKAERVLIARRLVASRCLYGVDKNPMAVELAKVSLWLVTMMKGRPFSFLDHALKCGDSLLGVSSLKQIEDFSLRHGERQVTFATSNLFHYVDAAEAKRRELEGLPSTDYSHIETKNRLHAEAEVATTKIKALADCLIALELRGLDGNAYEEARETAAEQVQRLLKHDADAALKSPSSNQQSALAFHAKELLRGRRPFHWPVEFPEVFSRSGFDAFVGNPPFQGGKKISSAVGSEYRELLVAVVASNKKGNADLSAYFFLRANGLMGTGSSFGLIATNSICQGETREVGLDQLIQCGRIIRAIPSTVWPGTANVFISIVWFWRGVWCGEHYICEKLVTGIQSDLNEMTGVSGIPFSLDTSSRIAFLGSNPRGAGFFLSSTEAKALIAAAGENAQCIETFLIGDDIMNSPQQKPSRFIINFRDWEEAEARKYPLLFKRCEELVLPKRREIPHKQTREKCVRFFWRYDALAKSMYEAIRGMKRVLATAQVSPTNAVTWISNSGTFDKKVVVFAVEESYWFGLFQSSVFWEWVRKNTATLGGSTLNFSPTDCVATLPMPAKEFLLQLNLISDAYFSERREILERERCGLTDFYNRFHNREEASADIARLRALHVELDHAVAAVYGWRDLELGHGFHPTKQGERYTISEPARRTVLDRLLALNHQRYEEEVKAGLHDKKASKKKRATPRSGELAAAPDEIQGELI
jgi:hypothetical protein